MFSIRQAAELAPESLEPAWFPSACKDTVTCCPCRCPALCAAVVPGIWWDCQCQPSSCTLQHPPLPTSFWRVLCFCFYQLPAFMHHPQINTNKFLVAGVSPAGLRRTAFFDALGTQYWHQLLPMSVQRDSVVVKSDILHTSYSGHKETALKTPQQESLEATVRFGSLCLTKDIGYQSLNPGLNSLKLS